MDILEFRVPSTRCREFAIHGFDPVEEGQKKLVDFCTRLETWNWQAPKKGQVNPEDRTVTFAENTPNKKKCANTYATIAKSEDKLYCSVHRINKSHNREDYFSVKRRKLAAVEKQGQRKNKVEFSLKLKDLNTFIEAKVQDMVGRHALKNKPKLSTANNATTINVNAFERFRRKMSRTVTKKGNKNIHLLNLLKFATLGQTPTS